MVKVEPRNPIEPGMTLELLTPGKTETFVVEDLFSVGGKPIEKIHGGLHMCWIPYETNPGKFALLREKIS